MRGKGILRDGQQFAIAFAFFIVERHDADHADLWQALQTILAPALIGGRET